jgi:hypothetical protein
MLLLAVHHLSLQAASALITSQLRDRGQKMVQAAEALSAAAAAAAANLGKVGTTDVAASPPFSSQPLQCIYAGHTELACILCWES